MAEAAKTVITTAGLKKIEDELNDLKVNRRREVAEKLKDARAQGDLSENAEYDAAKDEQREIEGRIEEIEEILKYAVVIDAKDNGSINIGNRVTLQKAGSDREYVFDIVGTTEADSRQHKISNESPVGSALIGKTVGDEIDVESAVGSSHYKVVKVERTPV